MHDVFISYSSKDQDVTEQIRQTLETNGISCWIAPRNIPLGSSYAREIPAAIRECTIFLLIGSAHAESSPWIRKELERAIIERKKIIPLMVEDVAFQDEFDFLLSLHQRYAAYEKTAETMERLVRDIRAILGVSDPVKAPAPVQIPESKPEPAAESPIASKLRFDGFYMTPEYLGTRTYYRFYPDNTMVYACTSATPAQAYQWLHKPRTDCGHLREDGDKTVMVVQLSDGHSWTPTLTFKGNKLLLSGYNTYSNSNQQETCTFLPFKDIH